MAACAAALTGEPVEPDPVSTGVGSRSCDSSPHPLLSSLRTGSSAQRIWLLHGVHTSSPLLRLPTVVTIDDVLEEVIVTATLREQSLLDDAGQHHCAERTDTARCRQTAFRGRARRGAEPELGRRHFAPALFPDPRHRRARAVRGRAESVRRFSDRRHRLQRHRHAGDTVRRRTASKCCAVRRACATARTRWRA